MKYMKKNISYDILKVFYKFTTFWLGNNHTHTALSPQIICFLLGCILICLIGSLIFEFVYGEPFTIYAAYFNSAQDHPAELAFIQIFSNLVVLNTFVPISLYVR
jgi:hypothetical protein